MPAKANRRRRPKQVEATAVIEKRGRWFVGYVAEIPGVNVQERTLTAVRESLRIALHELAEMAPEQIIGPRRRIERITVPL